MIDAATQTVLIPGSIWKKEGKRRDFFSTVLFVTNEGLDDDVLKKHPRQVVFLTEDFKVMSQKADFFVSCRAYSDMDQNMEALLAAITTPPEIEIEDDDEIDIDAIDLTEGTEVSDLQDNQESDGEQPSLVPTGGTVIGNLFQPPAPLEIKDHPLSATLVQNFVSYAESTFHSGDTLCILQFVLNKDLSLNDLRRAFGVDDANNITQFAINSAVGRTEVNIDGYIEVFISVQSGRTLGCVHLISAGDIRAQDQQDEDEPELIEVADPIVIPDEVVTEQPAVVTPTVSVVVNKQ